MGANNVKNELKQSEMNKWLLESFEESRMELQVMAKNGGPILNNPK